MIESLFQGSFIDYQSIKQIRPKRKVKRLRHGNHQGDTLKARSNYLTNDELTAFNIPPFLQNSYLNGFPLPKIISLRDWQKELLSREEWKNGKSAIVLVPTSGGKTLAADVAIAQTLETDQSSKIIYALPFVSLASEKTTEFRSRFPEYHVRPFYQNIGGPDFRRGSIAICTYEKVHSLLNNAIKDNYIEKFKLVIIDEIHMIGETQRGAIIEAMLVKLLLLRAHCEIRIIGLTATLNQGDATRLASWLSGFTHFCAARPSRIKHYYKQPNGQLYLMDEGKNKKFLTINSIHEDARHILNPIRNSLKQHPSSTVLVFVNTRRQTVRIGELLAKYLYVEYPNLPNLKPPDKRMTASREFLVQRLGRTETGLDSKLGECVKNGVAYHHAGMLLEERKLIEDAARESTISVIVATTTLSAGINIRSVARVIIYDMYRFGPGKSRQLLSTAVYTQMAGRAGRDESQGGDVFILGQIGDDQELNDALKLSQQNIEDLKSQLLCDGTADRFFLQCLVIGLLSPTDGIEKFVETCFESFVKKDEEIIKNISKNITERLRSQKLIQEDSYAPTSLGSAIAGSSLSIDEGLELKAAIDRLQNNLCLKDEVHLLYLCVPPNTIQGETTPNYEQDIWQQLYNEHQEVLSLITTLDPNKFERHIILTIQNGGKKMNPKNMAEHDRELDRFFFACLLQRLIAEQSVNEIVSFFNVPRGSVQSLQMQAATFAGQSVRFCETNGCRTLGRALNTFRERLNFGVKNELIPLMKLPSCNKFTARVLVTNRIPTPLELSEIYEEDIARILAAKRGADAPSDKDLELAKKLKEESKQIAKSLIIIDELENNAYAKAISDTLGKK